MENYARRSEKLAAKKTLINLRIIFLLSPAQDSTDRSSCYDTSTIIVTTSFEASLHRGYM